MTIDKCIIIPIDHHLLKYIAGIKIDFKVGNYIIEGLFGNKVLILYYKDEKSRIRFNDIQIHKYLVWNKAVSYGGF